ncbi:MAG: DNA primase [Bacteroidota bacterium]
MALIPANIVDEILQTARIEEVIGDFVVLKRAGSNLKGLSPFTDERTPSFVVSPGKQIFKCFSTSKGGNVASFLMEKEHFSYPEALKWLANRYNIEIPEEKPLTADELAQITERDSLFIINEFAKDFFVENMHDSDEGKAIGLSYFEERGFTKETIKKFSLGYSIDKSDSFTKRAIERGFKLEYLEKVGLVKSKDDRQFDFFRGRVMFPIQSVTGRVLGFGGRTLSSDKKIAKYFNSPESIIYNKSEILYGLFYAKGDIVKYDNCFLCEGYTDVISMHQAGIQNAVSSSGTSLTKGQIKLISRYTNNITILYDGDAAGIKASFRGIDLILEEGLNVKVVLFPDGDDPDSYSKKVSFTELESYIKDHTQDFISFKSSVLLADANNDPLKKAELIKEITHSVGLIPNEITRVIYTKQVAQIFEIDEAIVQNELLRIRKVSLSKQFQEPEIKELPIYIPSSEPSEVFIDTTSKITESVERELIRMMVIYGDYELIVKNEENELNELSTSVVERICDELKVDGLHFSNPQFANLHQFLQDGIDNQTIYKMSSLTNHHDQEIVKLVSELISDDIDLSPNWAAKHKIVIKHEKDDLDETITHVLNRFKIVKIESIIATIKGKMKDPSTSYEDQLILISEQMGYDRTRAEIAAQLGNVIIK